LYNYEWLQKKSYKLFNSQKLQKSIVINLSKKFPNLYSENDKTLMKEIEEDTNILVRPLRFMYWKN
jgi:hypothetical protein